MKGTKSANNDVARAGEDPIGIIRRSIRCFVFGLLGAVPGLGLALGEQAVALHRRVIAETGDSWRPAALHVYLAIGLVCICLHQAMFGLVTAVVTVEVFVAIGAYAVWRQYAAGRPASRNPARRYLFWGVGMAYLGRFLFLAFVAGILAEVWRARQLKLW